MNIYKHIIYNPHQRNIKSVIQEAQDSEAVEGSREWKFERAQPVNEYEWVAIFEKWQDEFGDTPPPYQPPK